MHELVHKGHGWDHDMAVVDHAEVHMGYDGKALDDGKEQEKDGMDHSVILVLNHEWHLELEKGLDRLELVRVMELQGLEQ